MDRRQFLKLLAQSSASVGATVFVEKVWGFPTIALLSRNNNKLFHWGVGLNGFAGTTGTNVLQPTKILPRHNFNSIQVGGSGLFVAVGITKKGDILTWGNNANFQQGPVAGSVASPVLFGNTTTWSQIAIDHTHGVGVRTNGTLWTWGDNASGQLGTGPIGGSAVSTPVQIIGSSLWASVHVGSSSTFALRTDGALWAWGANNGGFLGNGLTSGQTSTPIQIGSPNLWSSISVGASHVLATRLNGELWAWGQNLDGQLGMGDTIPRSSPVQIGTLTTWSKVFASNGISYGIKTDGTLWAWGYNDDGNLGIGSIVSKSSPVRVGSATNWLTVSPSFAHTLALKTDSTLWGWGTNDKGQLTGAIPASISTPIQLGSATSWTSIAAFGAGIAGSTSFGIRTK